MIEVRSPRPDELDEMLTVMCEAFNLPFGAARDVFYKDPYFDVRHKQILAADGHIASCLTVVDAPLWIGSAVVPVAGVAGVATRMQDRNRGYATRLLQDAIPALRKEGYGLAALFAVSAEFYKRLEWEPISSQVQLSLALDSEYWRSANSREARHVRAALPSDLPDFTRLYDAWSYRRTGCRARDEKRWRYLFEHVKHRVVYKRPNAPRCEGYALYDVREAEGKKPLLRLLEIVTESDVAERGLHAHLALRTDCERLEFTSGWREAGETGMLRAATISEGGANAAKLEIVPGPLVRVVDFAKCLEDLQPNWSADALRALAGGTVTLTCWSGRDAKGGGREARAETVRLDACELGQKIQILPVADHRDSDAATSHRQRIEGDARAWAAVLTGHLSLIDAVALGRVRATTDAAVLRLAALFPRRELAIPAADHF